MFQLTGCHKYFTVISTIVKWTYMYVLNYESIFQSSCLSIIHLSDIMRCFSKLNLKRCYFPWKFFSHTLTTEKCDFMFICSTISEIKNARIQRQQAKCSIIIKSSIIRKKRCDFQCFQCISETFPFPNFGIIVIFTLFFVHFDSICVSYPPNPWNKLNWTDKGRNVKL